MEAVKNGFTRVRGNAGTLVVDADADFVADARRGDLDQAAGRREADRIVDDVVDRSGQPAGSPITTAVALRGRAKAMRASPFSRRCLPADDELLDQRAEVDRLEPWRGRARRRSARPR